MHSAAQIFIKCMTSWSLSTSFHVNEFFDSLLAREIKDVSYYLA